MNQTMSDTRTEVREAMRVRRVRKTLLMGVLLVALMHLLGVLCVLALADGKPGNRQRKPARLSSRASWHAYGHSRMTVASRDYPCGTRVRFTNIKNKKSVVCTVADWGPARWTGRKWDLNKAAFARIAPVGRGVITVRATILHRAKKCKIHRH